MRGRSPGSPGGQRAAGVLLLGRGGHLRHDGDGVDPRSAVGAAVVEPGSRRGRGDSRAGPARSGGPPCRAVTWPNEGLVAWPGPVRAPRRAAAGVARDVRGRIPGISGQHAGGLDGGIIGSLRDGGLRGIRAVRPGPGRDHRFGGLVGVRRIPAAPAAAAPAAAAPVAAARGTPAAPPRGPAPAAARGLAAAPPRRPAPAAARGTPAAPPRRPAPAAARGLAAPPRGPAPAAARGTPAAPPRGPAPAAARGLAAVALLARAPPVPGPDPSAAPVLAILGPPGRVRAVPARLVPARGAPPAVRPPAGTASTS